MTADAPTVQLEAALSYLDRGWYPIPLCWPTTEGTCACFKRHKLDKEIGKAPLLDTGYQLLKPTEANIRQWWSRWPQANIGLLLEPSGLLVVDLDTVEGRQEAIWLGLPPSPVVGTGNGQHRYYLADGHAGRTCKRGDSRSFDILATGYIVAPPSLHRNGKEYTWWLHPDDAPPQVTPQWAIDMLAGGNNGHRSGVELPDSLPTVDVDALKVNPRIKELIHTGHEYPSRSEAMFAAMTALVQAGYDDATIASVITANPIGDKARQQGMKWLASEIARARAKSQDLASHHEAKAVRGFGPFHSQNLTSHYKGEPCEVRLREMDATLLVSTDGKAALESLPLLGQVGYVITGWGHLFSGYPKSGKTELIFRCVHDWIRGSKGPVLWFTEESEAVWRHRLVSHTDFPEGLRLVFAMGANPDDLLARVRAGTEPIVVVDTVRNLLGITDESDNALIARTLGAWEATLQSRTRLYLHHERKGGGEHGQGIAGGGAFLGVVDRAIELRFDQHDKRRRLLTVHSRIQEAPDLVYEMAEDGTLRALGEPDQVSLAEIGERAMEALSDEWCKTGELLDALGEPKPSQTQLRSALNSLVALGGVERDPPETKQGATYRWRLKT